MDKLHHKMHDKNQDADKSLGRYYTPDFIIDYILKRTVAKVYIIDNPFVKIIDPSCGTGYFLLAAYDLLMSIFTANIDNLNRIYKEEKYKIKTDKDEIEILGCNYWTEENLHYHILTHCIYGADIDSLAVDSTIKSLRQKKEASPIKDLNIVKCDSLFYWERLNGDEDIQTIEKNSLKKLIDFWNEKYDYVIGNPPYIGHKKLSKPYKKWLFQEYREVFKDKADISFCFFKRIKTILAPDGVCGIISSRYFMESPTGINLRRYLMENVVLIEIVDFYGKTIFKKASIATAIYFFKLNTNGDGNYHINIHKLNGDKIKSKEKIIQDKNININLFDSFKIPYHRLNANRWVIIPEPLYGIYEKIEHGNKVKLGDMAFSFQGIITGCDKAFVLNKDQIRENEIEKDIIKPWIKNKDISRYNIKEPSFFLIYSNRIDKIEDYPNSIKHIETYKDKLENRRECKNGLRKWHQLQWGREEKLFEQKKIIFPYKSKNNRFSIDYDNLYFSADIYGLIVKDDYKDHISLEYLLGILNSRAYEFYFKLFAKKMGRGIYDYYPNSLLDLRIISEGPVDQIENLTQKMIQEKGNTSKLSKEIDEIIMDYFDFDRKEKEIIKKMF